MIKFIKQQQVILVLVTLLFVFHLFSKDFTSPYERPIAGDAQAYYAYLPAIFIYQDFDYQFIETKAKPHYAEGAIKDFVIELEDGEKVNKTFPGVTILYSPFFIAGHLTALIFNKPADGFSSSYQIWFIIGLYVYLFFGLVFMRKVLEKLNFSTKTALFCVFLIVFGTNIFFYTVYDQSVTHIHNFFMINGLILCLLNYKSDAKIKWLLIAVGLLALIGITRPTNILVLGLIAFFFPSKDFHLSILKTLFSKQIWKFLLTALPILALPFVLWKVQTGHWIVYSYGEEGFNFADPYFASFLFSYTKGWMTYTPIVIPILIIGLILLFKENKKQFAIAVLFYLISIYVFSSWWCWYYGAGMSQRVMIDHYLLMAFLLAVIIKSIWTKPLLRYSLMSIFSVLAFFNVAQAYQIKNGIIKNGSATAEQYWDNFLVMKRKAIVYPKDHWQLIEKISFTKLMPETGPFEVVDNTNWITSVNQNQHYSATSSENIQPLKLGSKVILSFEAKALTAVVETRAALILKSKSTGEEISTAFFIKDYIEENEWAKMEFLYEPNQEFDEYMKVFFWNAGANEEVQFRNIKYTAYFSDEYM